MQTISDFINYHKGLIDYLDLEVLIANSLGKTREFILTHPEHEIPSFKIKNLKLKISRRMRGEPIAYITGHKEFYGLDFIVNKYTLVPRPETEMMVEEALKQLEVESKKLKVSIIDIGTGSGCIVISIAKAIENFKFIGMDISKDALKIAKKNAKAHGLDKKIKFLQGSLLTPFIKKHLSLVTSHSSLVITANLPYLSEGIYNSAPVDVKKFEPKSALYSAEDGLKHYRLLLEQIKKLSVIHHPLSVACFLEISPEQKTSIQKLIKSIFPKAKIELKKDLAGKWRMVKVSIS